jgi:hypothetical protein
MRPKAIWNVISLSSERGLPDCPRSSASRSRRDVPEHRASHFEVLFCVVFWEYSMSPSVELEENEAEEEESFEL